MAGIFYGILNRFLRLQVYTAIVRSLVAKVLFIKSALLYDFFSNVVGPLLCLLLVFAAFGPIMPNSEQQLVISCRWHLSLLEKCKKGVGFVCQLRFAPTTKT